MNIWDWQCWMHLGYYSLGFHPSSVRELRLGRSHHETGQRLICIHLSSQEGNKWGPSFCLSGRRWKRDVQQYLYSRHIRASHVIHVPGHATHMLGYITDMLGLVQVLENIPFKSILISLSH